MQRVVELMVWSGVRAVWERIKLLGFFCTVVSRPIVEAPPKPESCHCGLWFPRRTRLATRRCTRKR